MNTFSIRKWAIANTLLNCLTFIISIGLGFYFYPMLKNIFNSTNSRDQFAGAMIISTYLLGIIGFICITSFIISLICYIVYRKLRGGKTIGAIGIIFQIVATFFPITLLLFVGIKLLG